MNAGLTKLLVLPVSSIIRALWLSISVSTMTQAHESAGTRGHSADVDAVFAFNTYLNARGSGSVSIAAICHACDNQSHPRPKNSPSCLVPLPSCWLQIAEITHAPPLRTPYVIQHHLASSQPNLEHLKTSPERIQPHVTNLAVSPARPGSRRSTRLLKNSLLSLCYI